MPTVPRTRRLGKAVGSKKEFFSSSGLEAKKLAEKKLPRPTKLQHCPESGKPIFFKHLPADSSQRLG
jgi:hypothetical protein